METPRRSERASVAETSLLSWSTRLLPCGRMPEKVSHDEHWELFVVVPLLRPFKLSTR